jgi:Holliday junction resolvase RusA-like endonuclease
VATYEGYIEIPPMPKKRPVVTRDKNGLSHTYMPPAYTEWKEEAGWLMLAKAKGVKFKEGRIYMALVFDKDGFNLRIEDADEGADRFGQADLDNLLGAVMDAAQGCGLIRNDIDVVMLAGGFKDGR